MSNKLARSKQKAPVKPPTKQGPVPLKSQPLPYLDELYKGHNFMTITEVATGKKKIVGTRKSVTLVPLYEDMVVDDDSMVDGYAAILVDRLERQYANDRWRKLGHGLVYIQGYFTPEQWAAMKEVERMKKLNKLKKPTRANGQPVKGRIKASKEGRK